MSISDKTDSPVTQHFVDNDRITWMLTMQQSAYVMGIDAQGRLRHLYWGGHLPAAEDYPGIGRPQSHYEREHFALTTDEYPAWSGLVYTEPCLKVTFTDGVRDCRLTYQCHREETGPDGLAVLIITLKDTSYPLEVDLHYKVLPACNLIERWAVVRNTGQNWMDIEVVSSAAWQLPTQYTGTYRLTHLSGRWNSETQLQQTNLAAGRIVLESRRGLTSAEANPFFAIDVQTAESTGGGATEENGQVWFGALAWSGNWKIAIEQQSNPLRAYVAGGINDFDFRWRLNGGETFVTPPFVGGYTMGGFGQASRNLHLYQLDYGLPRSQAKKPRQILYNSWEAVSFNMTEANQLELARRAARLGVELFVMDDGWFGQRSNDRTSLGDWYVNPQKFPHGLAFLINEVNHLGMNFGIWIEPEMVNPDSDLYRAHPDWVYFFPQREGSLIRNQLLLNLARPEVANYVFNTLDTLLSTYNITFVKWDFNRPISEPGWPDAPLEQQREVYVRHVEAFYKVIEQLRSRHPNVVWEVCASGGGRADLGALSRFDQCWTSDNTNAFDRLFIQEGYSMAYAPKTMMAWVSTPSPPTTDRRQNHMKLSLKYRFHSAMTGSLGLGDDIRRYTEEEMTEVASLIAMYKSIRSIVQDGFLYRLVSPRHHTHSAVQYVNHDRTESVIFVFLHTQHYWNVSPRIYLRGLDPTYRYTIEGCENECYSVSGQSLMSAGIAPLLRGHFDSALIQLRTA